MKNSSRLVYDIAGKGFTQFRGSVDVDNARAEVGSTLNPQLRFFIFDAEPNMNRLLPPFPGMPLPGPAASQLRHAPSSITSSGRRSAARRRLPNGRWRKRRSPILPHRGRSSADAVADFLWAVLMKPEFQLIY